MTAFFRIIIFTVTLLCFGISVQAQDIDWVSIHERENKVSIAEALNALKIPPKTPEKLYQLALSCFSKHRDAKARNTFQEILTIRPDSYEARWGIAEYERRVHEYGKASAVLTQIIEEHPGFAPAYISLSYIKYMEFDFEAAVNLTAKVINLGRSNIDSYSYVRAQCIYAGAKGMIAYTGGPVSKAINGPAVLRHLRIARNVKPDCVAVYFGYGCYYLLSPEAGGRNLRKAEKLLKKSVELDPLFADGYARLAQLYRAKKDPKMYDFYLKKALQIDPKNILALDVKSDTCKFICNW